jgi:microcystin-dependent protein
MSDITASTWSPTDASNSTASPDGAPELMAPSGVNNTIRAVMGGTKRWYEWSIPKTTAGTSTAYTLSYTVAPSALVDGMTHLVEFDQSNGASATLNVNSLGAKPLHYYSAGAWRAVPASLFAANTVVHVAYNSGAGTYRILGRPDRTGEITAFAGATAPAGTLLCYGQAVSRTAYAGLFAALSTVHGTGDGSTTFNLPDLRGRTVFGDDDMGGAAASRLTTGSGGIDGATLGATGGTQTNTAATTVSGTTSGSLGGQTSAPVSGVGNVQAGGGGVVSDDNHVHNLTTSGSLTVSASGTSSAFAVIPPGIVLNYIIRV